MQTDKEMMIDTNIAILCPGPSITMYPQSDRSKYDLRIGINRGIGAYHCHYWVFLDFRAFTQMHSILSYRPGILTTPNIAQKIRRIDGHELYQIKVMERATISDSIKWTRYSLIAAIVGSISTLGATSIDVFGADWNGDTDFDGEYTNRFNRNPTRWQKESDMFDQIKDWAEYHGTIVNRITA